MGETASRFPPLSPKAYLFHFNPFQYLSLFQAPVGAIIFRVHFPVSHFFGWTIITRIAYGHDPVTQPHRIQQRQIATASREFPLELCLCAILRHLLQTLQNFGVFCLQFSGGARSYFFLAVEIHKLQRLCHILACRVNHILALTPG